MKKVALIFGITGQDGSYLAEFLLKKKYTVHGVKRRSSSINTGRIDHIYQDPQIKKRTFILHYGDITDSLLVTRLIKEIKPNEIYNLAAQSHVQVSFESPEYTANADALGALRILEAIRFNKLEKKQNTIKQVHQNYMAEMKKLLKMKEQTFILQVHMVLQNFMRIGLQSTIKKPITYLLVTVFCLIMKAQDEEKLSSLKKLFKLCVELKKKSKEHYFLVIYMPKEIGGMQETMLRQCGLCYNKKNLLI